MDCPSKVSPQAVVRALETLNDDKTEELVFHLGVETFTLDNIRISFTGSSRKIRLVQAWLDKDTDASWENIVSGLQQIRMAALAKDVATQYCPQLSAAALGSSESTTSPTVPLPPPVVAHSTCSSSSTAVTSSGHSDLSLIPTNNGSQPPTYAMKTETEARDTIFQLQLNFSDLICDTEIELCEKKAKDERFLRKFRCHLLALPVAKKAIHVKFFRESEDDLLQARTIEKIFAILSRYWSYFNYEILLHIINSFCTGTLQARMQTYCKMLREFEMSTTIDVYVCVMPPDKELEDAFSKMVLKIDKTASQCTLYDIRKLNEAITEGSSLCSHSVYVSSVTTNCVVVVVRFPSSAAGWVMAAMTPNFMHTHHLIEVAMDGKYLTVVEEDRKELVCVFRGPNTCFVLHLCCVVLPYLWLAPPPQH